MGHGRKRIPIPLGIFPGSDLDIIEELEAVRHTAKSYHGFSRRVKAYCLICGEEKEMSWDNIKSGQSKTCGCTRKYHNKSRSGIEDKKKTGEVCNLCTIFFHQKSGKRVVCKSCFGCEVKRHGFCDYPISEFKEGVHSGIIK